MIIKSTGYKKPSLFKRANVLLMIILSIFSLGLYIGIWFINRKKDLEIFDRKRTIPFKWWNVFVAILFVFMLLNMLKNFVFTEYGFLYIESFDIIFTFFMMGLVNYSAFRSAEALEENTDIEFNRVLLFFFTIFYLQHKSNRYELNHG